MKDAWLEKSTREKGEYQTYKMAIYGWKMAWKQAIWIENMSMP